MLFVIVSILAILIVLSPGPDFFLVLNNSLSFTRQGGFYTALGIACSTLLHATYCIVGIGLIIYKSPDLLQYVRYAGALYLLYLGIKAFFSKTNLHMDLHTQKQQMNYLAQFQQGFLCNLLNPKTILFFISLYSAVISTNTPLPLQIFFGVEIAFFHFIWFLSVSFFITHRKVFSTIKSWLHLINKAAGLILISFAVMAFAY